MKAFKTYILSALTLISATNLAAMSTEPTITPQSQHSVNTDVLAMIRKESLAVLEGVLASIRAICAGNPKEMNILKTDALEKLIQTLPASDLKEALNTFTKNVNNFDQAAPGAAVSDLVEQLNDSYKSLQAQCAKVKQINQIQKKLAIKATPINNNSQLLEQLACAFHADVETMVQFDVRSQKIAGSLKLGQCLTPFVAKLDGKLVPLREPLLRYIEIASTFDAATDTELMESVSQAIECLSERIAYYRNMVKDEQPNQQKAPKRVTFNEAPQIKMVKKYINRDNTPMLQKQPSLTPLTTLDDAIKSTYFKKNNSANNEKPNIRLAVLRQKKITPSHALVHAPHATPAPRIRKQSRPLLTPQEKKNALIVSTALATPLLVGGTMAAYDAGYVTPALGAINTAASALGTQAMQAANSFQIMNNQIIPIAGSIARNIGNLGTHAAQNLYRAFAPAYAYCAPYFQATCVNPAIRNSMLMSGLVVGAHNINKYYKRSTQSNASQPQASAAQPVQQNSAVVIEELDVNNNVIPGSQKIVKPQRKHLTKRQVYGALGVATGLAGLGYAAYNYFAPATPAITSNAMPITAAPSISAPTIALTANAPSFSQDTYHWLAGQSINPWQ